MLRLCYRWSESRAHRGRARPPASFRRESKEEESASRAYWSENLFRPRVFVFAPLGDTGPDRACALVAPRAARAKLP